MSQEPQFLSFKGLKQYTPDGGWDDVNSLLQQQMEPSFHAPPKAAPKAAPSAPPADIPTLTETPDLHEDRTAVFDPLISELFEQLKVAPSDDLTQTWRTIAAEVNLLTQRMALRRDLQDRIAQLDKDMGELRQTILMHLRDVQHAADQQLTSARLRAEVSALAKSKLAARLNGEL